MPDGRSVLLIEDDRQLLRTLSDILRLRGYRPMTAASGHEGLQMLGQARPFPAIALVDLRLPDMDGTEVIAQIHALAPLTEAIVLTGNASVDSAVHAMRELSSDYLVKPVSPQRLYSTLERAGERWQRRKAEDALRRSEERSQRLLEHISDIVAVVGDDLIFRYVSPSVARISGYRPDDLVGRSCLEVTHPDDADLIVQAIGESRTPNSAPRAQRMRMRHVSGDWRVLEVTSARLGGQEESDGLVLTARDVTDRQRLEDELRHAQKMESVGRLAGGVAHDFNNLLTAILGFSEILIDEADPTSRHWDDLQAIYRAAEHGASLTRQLLAFSRRQFLEPTLLDLGSLAHDLQSILRRLLGEPIDTVLVRDPDLGLVKADRGQIEQVLMNLAVNARDAMPDGGTLTIETRRGRPHAGAVTPSANSDGGDHALLIVRDTGLGMDQETRTRLFEPFFTTKAPGKGTGLGLATVYGIVQQSGGHIEVATALGQGTTFTIYLPIVQERDDRVVTPGASARPPDAREDAGAILLVEDDAALRELLSRTLRHAGYAVAVAENAEDALALVHDTGTCVDLLVTDVVMPGMTGPALARTLVAQQPTLRVLLMSGYTDDETVRAGLLDAGHSLLLKPFGPRTFLQKVQQVCQARPRADTALDAVAR